MSSRKRVVVKARQSPNKPPQFKSNIITRHRYRFVSSNGTRTGITPTSILCSAGTICQVVNAAVTAWNQSCRINSISMWAPPASQGSTSTCSVEWVGISNQSNNVEVSDTTNSVTTPAHIRTQPPPKSLASFWQQPSSTVLANIVAPPGTIIDVDLSLVAQDDNSNIASTLVASAVLSNVYYLSLDPNATHYYTPISLNTTT
jgi:hypothetical protein